MSSTVFLKAKWEYLAMFNYEVDPEILKPHLPPYTEIDYFDGKALVSVVGFLFNKTKVLGIQWPGLVNFEEVNLRFYVKFHNGKEWKRGVAFISEIVPKALIAFVANALYNEHYSTARMNHDIVELPNELRVSYRWKRAHEAENRLSLTANPVPADIEPGSAEEFIFEHYFGYNKLNDATTIEYSVEHPRWQVFKVNNYHLTADIGKLYGSEFVKYITDITPHSVYLAKGSEVKVRMLRKVKRGSGN